MNNRLVNFYMTVANQCANMSRARRLQVGSVIVKDDNIISFSWNGTPSGWDNNCEEEYLHEDGSTTLKTRPEVLHAESNAIAKLARSNNSGCNADIFITHAPCLDCAKLIYQSGIRRVWFGQAYRDSAGIEFLQRSGIEVTQHDNTKI